MSDRANPLCEGNTGSSGAAVSATIAPAGDTDAFTISVDPGQTITVLVTPTSSTLLPGVQLRNAAGTVVGTATAAAAGQKALLETIATTGTATETYSIDISGGVGTTGVYNVQVTLNAALEMEGQLTGVANNTLGTAQNIDGAFSAPISIEPALQRGAVLGQTDGTTAPATVIYGPIPSAGLRSAGSAFTTIDGTPVSNGLAVHNQDAPVLSLNSNLITPLAAQAAVPDYYSCTVAAGEMDSFVLTGLGTGTITLDLLDASGTVLASGLAGTGNVAISKFSFSTAGTYYLRVAGDANVAYSLLATRNAAFDTEPNDSFAAAQNITGAQGVIGSIGGGSGGTAITLTTVDDGWWDNTGLHSSTNKNYITGQNSTNNFRSYYVFNLAAVTQPIAGAQLNIANPTNGFSSPDPTETLSIYDVSTPLATLEASGSGLTAIYNDLGTGSVFGSQTVSTASNGQFVPITLNAAGIAALNAVRGQQVALGGALTTVVGTSLQFVFGYTTGSEVRQLVLTTSIPDDWYALNVTSAGALVSLATHTPADGTGQFANTLNPHLELYDPTGTLVGSGLTGTDGRNESLAYAAPAPGLYRIRVTSENNTQGEYVLDFGPALGVGIPLDVHENDGTVLGTLSLAAAAASDVTVTLISSDPARLTVPATWTVPAGQMSVSFPITLIDNNLLDGPEQVSVHATATGYMAGGGTMTVHDDETAILTAALPPTAREGDGAVTGVITASAAPTRDLAVTLSSSLPGRATVPATIILKAGQTTANFSLNIIDNTVIDGTQSVTVNAGMDNWTGGTAALDVQDNDATITVTLPASGWEGQTLSGAGTVRLGGTLTSNLVVTLGSSDTTELTVPASVTVLAGQTTATFNLSLLADGQRDGAQTATVTATAPGLTDGNSSLVVHDSDLDHLVFDAISGPQTDAVPFAATARAYNVSNEMIAAYAATTTLSATGQGGAIALTPTLATFAAGVWSGNVTINTVDPAVTLSLNTTGGNTGTSNAFTVQPGAVNSLQWSPIGSSQAVNVPFAATLMAKDVNGFTVTNFNNSASLSGLVGTGTGGSSLVISEVNTDDIDSIEFTNVTSSALNIGGWQVYA
ncbi:MAG: hypothetical protein WCI73_09895, partial [Phycisphaerae bacterium]